MPQKVTLSTAAPVITISPVARVLRTVLQVAVALGAAIPIIVNSGVVTTPKVLAILSTALIVVTTAQNLLEHAGVLPVIGGTVPPTPGA